MSSNDDMVWMHQLRNAVNAACVALDVARRSLDASELERARLFLVHAEDACARSRALLSHPGQPAPSTPGDPA